MGVLNLSKKAFKDEFNGRTFTQEGSCEVLRNYPKWDAPEAVPSAPVEGGHAELFGEDSRPRPPGARATKKNEIREHVGLIAFLFFGDCGRLLLSVTSCIDSAFFLLCFCLEESFLKQ
ncbi:hypothetical protein Tco_0534722 [Tanacetum coccineum]